MQVALGEVWKASKSGWNARVLGPNGTTLLVRNCERMKDAIAVANKLMKELGWELIDSWIKLPPGDHTYRVI